MIEPFTLEFNVTKQKNLLIMLINKNSDSKTTENFDTCGTAGPAELSELKPWSIKRMMVDDSDDISNGNASDDDNDDDYDRLW